MDFQFEFGVISKRYKRFLTDIALDSGQEITAHLANTGSMKTCWEPGYKAALTYNPDPKRKLKYSLFMLHNGESWINVNTHLTNNLVEEALKSDVISELVGKGDIKREVKVGDSRIDFRLGDNCYIEVKNVTLRTDDGMAAFPDAVSTRGQKHLRELVKLVKEGNEAYMLYVVGREDVSGFRIADDIDPGYAREYELAKKAGVKVLVYGCSLCRDKIFIHKSL